MRREHVGRRSEATSAGVTDGASLGGRVGIPFGAVLLLACAFAAGCSGKATDPGPVAPVAGGGSARGIAVCVGLNGVDPDHYAGWPGRLFGCENDAADMEAIARQKGFAVAKILTRRATRDAVLSAIRGAAEQLHGGDIFMVSFSGHGDQVPDPHAPPEDGGLDQTWCLYDGQLLDKELYAEWARFAAGVRILVFSDSCHSQGIARMAPRDYAVDLRLRGAAPAAPESEPVRRVADASDRFRAETIRDARVRVKAMPPEKSIETYQREQARYDGIVRSVARPTPPIPPLVMSITACKNDQLAGDGDANGVFTGAVKRVWDGGAFRGNYIAFHEKVAEEALRVRSSQDAQRRMIDRDDQGYWKQSPFAISAP
jgi:hypothetical protein